VSHNTQLDDVARCPRSPGPRRYDVKGPIASLGLTEPSLLPKARDPALALLSLSSSGPVPSRDSRLPLGYFAGRASGTALGPVVIGDPRLDCQPEGSGRLEVVRVSLPTGTVTFLLTDIEGSTRLWEHHGEAMGGVVTRHEEIIASAVKDHGGELIKAKGEGDSTFSVFARTTDAAAAALEAQSALRTEAWAGPSLSVRMALHSGEADLRDSDYFGAAVNRAARLREVAHGGQTLLSQSAFALVEERLPAGSVVVDLGTHRLRDLARAERVYELRSTALNTPFPALRSLNAVPNNLPVQLTSFVGREVELADLVGRLGSTRMLTLTGAAGCGKTRLALQLAAGTLDVYPDGVWLVDLAPIATSALVIQAVGSALGVRERTAGTVGLDTLPQSGPALEELVFEFLADRQALMIIDNSEHLVGAVAKLAERLLRARPGLRLLVTSREPLGVGGEVTWRVPSLGLPDPAKTEVLTELAATEAVRLFVERAEERDREFVLSPEAAVDVVDICQRLDGIPLAIELAAARVTTLSCAQIASRLDDRFRLLTGGSRTALERHQTLRAAVDWSYEALGPAEQALLARLSLFAGGFSLEAAEAVCEGEPVEMTALLDLLATLVDKSLVVHDPQTGRYRLLEMIRQYARERLAADDDPNRWRRRHFEYYLQVAKDADRVFWGTEGADQAAALEADLDNLRSAMEFCLAERDPDAALRLSGTMLGFWVLRGHLAEGRRWLAEALATPGGQPGRRRAWAMFCSAFLAALMNDLAEARPLCEGALVEFRRLGDDARTAMVSVELGQILIYEGDHTAARPLLEESLGMARTLGLRPWVVQAAVFAGTVAHAQGDLAAAYDLYQEAAGTARSLGGDALLATALVGLGVLAFGRGDWVAALAQFDAAMEASRLNESIELVGSLSYRALALARLGNREMARAAAEECIELRRRTGYRPGWGLPQAVLGELALDEGDMDAARTYCADATRGASIADMVGGSPAHSFIRSLTRLALASGDASCAARLLAAFAAQRSRQRITVTPSLAAEIEEMAHEVQTHLTADEWERAQIDGVGMSVDEAIADVLGRRVMEQSSEGIEPRTRSGT
jgi:predicted ATPase/class 3 adenylate cyclase